MKIHLKFMLFLAFLSVFWAKNRGKFAPKYLFDSLNEGAEKVNSPEKRG
jgi:hypothetical protein